MLAHMTKTMAMVRWVVHSGSPQMPTLQTVFMYTHA